MLEFYMLLWYFLINLKTYLSIPNSVVTKYDGSDEVVVDLNGCQQFKVTYLSNGTSRTFNVGQIQYIVDAKIFLDGKKAVVLKNDPKIEYSCFIAGIESQYVAVKVQTIKVPANGILVPANGKLYANGIVCHLDGPLSLPCSFAYKYLNDVIIDSHLLGSETVIHEFYVNYMPVIKKYEFGKNSIDMIMEPKYSFPNCADVFILKLGDCKDDIQCRLMRIPYEQSSAILEYDSNYMVGCKSTDSYLRRITIACPNFQHYNKQTLSCIPSFTPRYTVQVYQNDVVISSCRRLKVNGKWCYPERNDCAEDVSFEMIKKSRFVMIFKKPQTEISCQKPNNELSWSFRVLSIPQISSSRFDCPFRESSSESNSCNHGDISIRRKTPNVKLIQLTQGSLVEFHFAGCKSKMATGKVWIDRTIDNHVIYCFRKTDKFLFKLIVNPFQLFNGTVSTEGLEAISSDNAVILCKTSQVELCLSNGIEPGSYSLEKISQRTMTAVYNIAGNQLIVDLNSVILKFVDLPKDTKLFELTSSNAFEFTHKFNGDHFVRISRRNYKRSDNSIDPLFAGDYWDYRSSTFLYLDSNRYYLGKFNNKITINIDLRNSAYDLSLNCYDHKSVSLKIDNMVISSSTFDTLTSSDPVIFYEVPNLVKYTINKITKKINLTIFRTERIFIHTLECKNSEDDYINFVISKNNVNTMIDHIYDFTYILSSNSYAFSFFNILFNGLKLQFPTDRIIRLLYFYRIGKYVINYGSLFYSLITEEQINNPMPNCPCLFNRNPQPINKLLLCSNLQIVPVLSQNVIRIPFPTGSQIIIFDNAVTSFVPFDGYSDETYHYNIINDILSITVSVLHPNLYFGVIKNMEISLYYPQIND